MIDTIAPESRRLLEWIAAQTFEVPDGYECQQPLAGCVRKDQLTEEQRLDLIPLLDRKLVAESTRTCEGPTQIISTTSAADIPQTPRQRFNVIEITDRGRLEMESHSVQSSGEPANATGTTWQAPCNRAALGCDQPRNRRSRRFLSLGGLPTRLAKS
jgi:hypothetical protein